MSEARMMIRNPILPIADPYVARHDGRYYVTGTGATDALQVWVAPTLSDLRGGRPVTVWRPQGDEPAHQIWSPSLYLLPHRGGDRWFIYFTASSDDTNRAHRIYALRSEGADPLGPYTFMGQPIGMSDATAIDPSLLRLRDRLYLLYVEEPGDGPEPDANVIYIAPLNDPLTLGAAGRPLVDPDQPWERGSGGHSSYPVAEGPIALHHDGRTFVVYSGGHTGNHTYCLGLLAYDGVGDPLDAASWTKSGPVFSYSAANGVYGPGRASFTTSPDGGEHWMVYHAKADRAYSYRGRTTRAQRFTWNDDGTPSFGVPVRVDQADIPTRVIPRSNR